MSCLLDEGELPTQGGQRPHLVLTMRLTDLIDGLGTATLDTLAQRDKGCAFPGCDRSPRYCEAHYILEWLNWGETKLDNKTPS